MRRPKPEPMWRRYLRFLGPNVAADVDDEVDDHISRLESELRERGVPEAEIAVRVRARFGDPDAVRARLKRSDELRHQRGLRLEALGNWGQDIAYALRRLRQRPGFTGTVVIVLALGIGATTAMFSAVDAAMLRPLPFPRADQLVLVQNISPAFDRSAFRGPAETFHTPDLGDLRAATAVFSHVAAYAAGGLNLADPARPVRVQVGVVTQDFFNTMGVPPATGRGFNDAEGKPGGRDVVVLSDALWRNHYGARPMLDSTISLSGKLFTVIGVMPHGFSFPDRSELWIPLTDPMTMKTFAAFRNYVPSQTIARLADGVTVDAGNARVLDIWRQAEKTIAVSDSEIRKSFAERIASDSKDGFVLPFRQFLVTDSRLALLVLLGASALLLLIACANVTNLLLSQAAVRRREIAVRAVLGATRARMIRQMLTESVLLAGTGTLLGIAVARPMLGVLSAVMPKPMAGLSPAELDWRVLAFASALALATGIGFGLWPALGASRSNLGEAMNRAAGRAATSGGAGRGRRLLVAMELALATVLLVGTGLMLRSLQHLVSLNTGLQPAHVATLNMSFGSDVTGQTRRAQEIEEIVRRLELVPGITAAGVVNLLPLSHTAGGIGLYVGRGGELSQKADWAVSAAYLQASGGYFRAMGISLLEGRTFTAADDSGAPPVVVVDRAFADTIWPGEDPIGRTIQFSTTAPPLTVVGVVERVRLSLTSGPGYQMYQPTGQVTPGSLTLVARGSLPPTALMARLRDVVHAVDPSQAVFQLRTMDDVVTSSIAPQRTNGLLIALFGVFALVLTVLGEYAVVSYSVAQRRRELGIRLALGASRRQLVRLVSREMVWVSLGGLTVGLGAAWAAAHVMTSLIYGITTHDPITFVLAPLVLIIPAAVATLLPARRAARTNPVDVMREE